MTGRGICAHHWRTIGADNRNGCHGFRCHARIIRHHITHVYCRAFTIGQTVEIIARHKLQLVVDDADRALITEWIAVVVDNLHTVQTEVGKPIVVVSIGIIGQYINREGFIVMAGLRIHVRYRCIIGTGNRYAGRGFRRRPISIGRLITHGDGRAFTFGQVVKITTRCKLQLVVNNTDRTLTAYRITLAINNLHAVQAEA